jgi:hypothetical protein
VIIAPAPKPRKSIKSEVGSMAAVAPVEVRKNVEDVAQLCVTG